MFMIINTYICHHQRVFLFVQTSSVLPVPVVTDTFTLVVSTNNHGCHGDAREARRALPRQTFTESCRSSRRVFAFDLLSRVLHVHIDRVLRYPSTV